MLLQRCTFSVRLLVRAWQFPCQMDVLSLTTGILALLGACTTVARTFKKIERLKEAPVLIKQLNNETSDLCLILSDVSSSFQKFNLTNSEDFRFEQRHLELCSSLLVRTRGTIEEVKILLERRILKSEGPVEGNINWKAFLQKYKKLRQLQETMRDDRQQITGLFSQLGLLKVSSIAVKVDSIQATGQDLMQSHTRLESRVDQIYSRLVAMSIGSEIGDPDAGFRDRENSSGIALSVTWSSPQPRGVRCTCRNYETLISAYSRFAIFFFGYMAAPVDNRGATKCPYHSDTYNVLFVFPVWFIRRSVAFQTELRRGGSIRCALRVRQLIPQDHPVFSMIEAGNFGGVRRLINTHQVSVDAHVPAGGSILKVSVIKDTNDLVKVLIAMYTACDSRRQPVSNRILDTTRCRDFSCRSPMAVGFAPYHISHFKVTTALDQPRR